MVTQPRPTDPEYYMSLEYGVKLWVREGSYILAIPQLSLASREDGLAAAYDGLVQRKREYFEALIAAGRERDIRLPADIEFRAAFLRRVAPFSFKAVVAALIAVLFILSVMPVLKYQVRELGREARIAARSYPAGIMDGLADLKALSPDRQAKAAKGVRAFIEALYPVLREAEATLDALEAAEPRKETSAKP